MRTITDKKELAEFFRDTLLPYYEKHYREDLTMEEAKGLYLDSGLCLCSEFNFITNIYNIMDKILGDNKFILEAIMICFYTAKESLIPRIEWMKQFIKETL